ncbi:MAG: glycosyltransferase family 4 protein [Flavobacteriaceae bacterium]|nr:glycosyltransferase family 4 protein [Flavobacteriaceae bacterium]
MKKKILIIGPIPIEFGGKEFGGVCSHITDLSKNLSDAGFEVTLWNYKRIKPINKGSIRVIPNTFFSFLGALCSFFFKLFTIKMPLKSRLLYIYQLYRLKQILKLNKFDVIHVHSLKNTVSIALQEINNRIPFVITDHGFWNQKGIENKQGDVFKRTKKCIEGCSRLIYISDFAKEKHGSFDFNQKDKLIKIANPISINAYYCKKNQIDCSKKTVFFNGLTHTVEIKNLPILLHAIENDSILREKVKLVVLSNKKGRDYIKKHDFSFEIEVFGKMNFREVIELYKQSDTFVLPSKSDSFGLVYLEALSYSVPIIGLTKLFEEFQSMITEYIGEPFDSNLESSEDLAKKIKIVLNKKINSKKIHEQLLANYSWEHNIHKYIDVYRQVLKK